MHGPRQFIVGERQIESHEGLFQWVPGLVVVFGLKGLAADVDGLSVLLLHEQRLDIVELEWIRCTDLLCARLLRLHRVDARHGRVTESGRMPCVAAVDEVKSREGRKKAERLCCR